MRPLVVSFLIERMFGMVSSLSLMPGTREGSEKDSDRMYTTVLSVRLLERLALMVFASAAYRAATFFMVASL